MALYRVPMSYTIHTSADVEADSVDEALEKANKLDCLDDGRSGGECVDWDVLGEPEFIED